MSLFGLEMIGHECGNEMLVRSVLDGREHP